VAEGVPSALHYQFLNIIYEMVQYVKYVGYIQKLWKGSKTTLKSSGKLNTNPSSPIEASQTSLMG